MELEEEGRTILLYIIMIENIIARVHRELCAVYVTQNIMKMHIVYSLSVFVDRGAYNLSISNHVKNPFEHSSRRAEFCEF